LISEGQFVSTEFKVALTSLSANSSSGTDNLTNSELPVAAVLDSGSTTTRLPLDLVQLVFEELGIGQDGVVPCSLAQHNGTLNFGL